MLNLFKAGKKWKGEHNINRFTLVKGRISKNNGALNCSVYLREGLKLSFLEQGQISRMMPL